MTELSAVPRRFGRNSALLVLGTGLLMLAAIAIGPHIWNYDLTRRAVVQQNAATALELEAKRLSSGKQRLVALSDPKIAKSMLLPGATAGLNGAQLQKQVAEIARGIGIAPHSLRVSDAEKWKEGLRNLSLEIGMRGSLEKLQRFLFAVETRLPLMFVESMTAARPDASRGGGSDHGPLEISIVVRGVALSGDAK